MRNYMFILILSFLLPVLGCSALPFSSGMASDTPILTMEEVSERSYTKIGRINIRRTVHLNDYVISPNLQEWAVEALQQEATKLGADAIIFPEVSSRELSQIGIPSFPATEYRASGTAIRFK